MKEWQERIQDLSDEGLAQLFLYVEGEAYDRKLTKQDMEELVE